MSDCCGSNPCAPHPVDVTINSTTTNLDLGDNGAQFQTETLDIVADVGVLTYEPVHVDALSVYVNGQLIDEGCWILNGTTLTFGSGVLPDQAEVVVKYLTAQTVTGVSMAEVGTMAVFATDSIPAGWLLCNGDAVLRAGSYNDLFLVIGETYGAGDGSTTFNLPDLASTVYDGTQYVSKPMIIKH